MAYYMIMVKKKIHDVVSNKFPTTQPEIEQVLNTYLIVNRLGLTQWSFNTQPMEKIYNKQCDHGRLNLSKLSFPYLVNEGKWVR